MKPKNIQTKKVVFNKTKTGVNAKMSFSVSLMKNLGVEDGTVEDRSIKMLEYDDFIVLTKKDIDDERILNIITDIEKNKLFEKISDLENQLKQLKEYLNK